MARVLATVVATAGSTYRKPGARMLIMADGSYLGLLSGGCLEADLKLHAGEVLDGGATRAVEYDMRGPDDVLFGIGAGCEGAMRVLLEPANSTDRAAAALAAAGRITAAGASTCLVCVHESSDIPLGTYGTADGNASIPPALAEAARSALTEESSREIIIGQGRSRLRAFVEFLPPPPHLLLCGAGPDAQPVAAAAHALARLPRGIRRQIPSPASGRCNRPGSWRTGFRDFGSCRSARIGHARISAPVIPPGRHIAG